jgi:1-acyl-sn-glycerol-3-phosphate acyltransferase
MKERLKLSLFLWTIGLLGSLLLAILVFSRRISIKGFKRMTGEKGRVIIANHPSLVEPLILPFLFFPHFLFSRRAVPLSTPDYRNFYSKYWYAPLRPVSVPINRGENRKEKKTIDYLKTLLKKGRTIILYPEGGRTFKGKNFRLSKTGKRIASFPSGIRHLFKNIDCEIIPVWVKGTEKLMKNRLVFSQHRPFIRFWRHVEIRIGPVYNSRDLPRDKKLIVPFLENLLLRQSD